MKVILVTQRIDNISSYNERRDGLDQRWIEFLLKLKLLPIPVPNNIEFIKKYLANNSIDGILLTGGGNLAQYQGKTPERDIVEKYLLDYAIEYNIPVLGVCRGMQVIQTFFSNSLQNIKDHVASEHNILLKSSGRISQILQRLSTVNSYHEYGTFQSVEDLIVIARSSDNVIEAIEHVHLPIFGIMWHPERNQIFNQANLDLFRYIFDNQSAE